MRFPRDHWYVGALSAEVGHVPLARTLLGVPVVFYRTAAGQAVAVAGVCPHRGYPMSRATVVEGGIRCGYHGLTFADDSGICRALASDGNTNAAARLRQFPVLEAGPFVWLWLGEPDRCDPALLPAAGDIGMGRDDWRTDPTSYVHVAARYGTLCDNLLDTTHIDFVHAGSLGRAPLRFEELYGPTLDRIGVARESCGNDAALFASLLPDVSEAIDVAIAAEFCGPALIVAVRTDFTCASENGHPPEPRGTMAFIHALTPETETSTHYFPAFVRNFRLDDERFSAEMNARNLIVAREDQAAVEAIESATRGAAFDAPTFSLPGDDLALLARRKIAQLLAAEE